MATTTKVKKATKKAHCCIKGCVREVESRGACSHHYQSALKSVQAGKTSWEELERLGVVLAAQPRSNGFLEFLTERRTAEKAKKPAVKKKAKPVAATAPREEAGPAVAA